MKPGRPKSVRHGVRETAANREADWESHVSRRPELSNRGVRWRRSCYPAVTPALELARFELQTRRRRWDPSAGREAAKRLCAREIRW